jgi:hypothetical protein
MRYMVARSFIFLVIIWKVNKFFILIKCFSLQYCLKYSIPWKANCQWKLVENIKTKGLKFPHGVEVSNLSKDFLLV